MGSSSQKQQTQQQTTVTATPEEQAMERVQLGQMQAADPYQRAIQAAGGTLMTNLLTGNEAGLPSFYKGMTGIDPNAIASQASELTRQNLPGFQSQGLMDSGTMDYNIQKMIANQLLFPAAQYNIGARQNLLNLALSGQAQVQAPMQANTSQLGSQLAGLRSTSSSSTTTQTSNPFLNSFYSSLGNTLGSPSFKTGPFTFGR